jgi:dTDP-glucose pyrophosphorylase|tara:strand:- start:6 stop:803 length:798 start_codon:yes stop_codon:yes gene_type:complete
MIILIPMGGKGSRFTEQGYRVNKSMLPVTSRFDGTLTPMALSALTDIPWAHKKNSKILCVNDASHQKNGLEHMISSKFKNTIFIHDHVKLDQAYGCYLAREFLVNDDELFIGTCDNGFNIDLKGFTKLTKTNDAIMLSHTNDNNISHNPSAHSWAKLQNNSHKLQKLSFKKTVSNNPMNDHATTGMFWFKSSKVFLAYLEIMIKKNDTYDGKFYVDKILNYYIEDDLSVSKFDVEYFGWGTPYDYETYEKTVNYWNAFHKLNLFL